MEMKVKAADSRVIANIEKIARQPATEPVELKQQIQALAKGILELNRVCHELQNALVKLPTDLVNEIKRKVR